MITEVGEYFSRGCGRCGRFGTPDCSTRLWAAGLAALRQVCLNAGLHEEVKWGHPCYTRAGRNVAIIGAFRGDFRLSFFDAALMRDPHGLLQRQGPNSRHADALRFGTAAEVDDQASAITELLAEARAIAEAGLRAPHKVAPLDIPADLAAAFAQDAALAQAFQALTPGRQRSHVIALASAKTSATRQTRIQKLRPRIMVGKGATER